MHTTARAYSMSGLQNVDCLRRYKAVVEDRPRVEEGGVPALRGQVLHEAAHLYVEALADAALHADFELAQQAIQAALSSIALPMDATDDARMVFQRWAEHFTLDLDAYLCAEELQTECGFRWRPDIVMARPSELEIGDWKSHYAAFTEVEARAHFQTRFYLWRAMQVWPGFPVYRFTYDFMRLNTQVSVTMSHAEVQDVEDDVAAKIALVDQARATGEWPATLGPLCAWCSLTCDAVDDARKRPCRVTTDAEAQQAAVEMSALSAAIKSRQEAVQAWSAAHGPIVAGGRRYEWKPQRSMSYPAGTVISLYDAHGVAVPASLTFSGSALGSALTAKKHADLAKDIGAYATEKVGRRWSETLDHETDG